MRPVRLVMDGFASFRNRAVVDFIDADYFVLVGPTGAGKSTVIDAITFALYGTVPRWGDQRMIAPALAPTANRGVVHLIFDADGSRYVVARDVRRSGGKNARVSVHGSRLEKLDDPEDIDGESTLLAADSEVTGAVEKLLGLSYPHFTTCVALPQNQFAEFLHAKPSERQDILSSLLGYHLYDDIQKRANSRARDRRSTSEALTKSLEGYADATAGHLRDLKTRSEDLEQLQAWFDRDGQPGLERTANAVSAAEEEVKAYAEHAGALRSVRVPSDVATLDAELTDADSTLRTAATVRADAETAQEQAAAAVSEFRPRHEMLDLLRNWQELTAAEETLPELNEQVAEAEKEHNAAKEAVIEAEGNTESLRKAESSSATRATEARDAVLAAQQQVNALTAIAVPESVSDLVAALSRLADRRRDNARAAEQAEGDLAAARKAIAACPGEVTLSTGSRTSAALRDSLDADLDAWERRQALASALVQARQAREDAQDRRDSAAEQLKEARLADEAGLLRAHLVAGQPCPVCEQQVVTLPAAHASSQVAAHQAVFDASEKALTEALRTFERLDREAAADQISRTEALHQAENHRLDLLQALQGMTGNDPKAAKLLEPLSAQVDTDTSRDAMTVLRETAGHVASFFTDLAARRVELVEAEEKAELQRQKAAAERASIEKETLGIDQEQQKAVRSLNDARDTLSALSPPPLDVSDLSATWSMLAGWADERRGAIGDRLPALSEAAEAAGTKEAASKQQLDESIERIRQLRQTQGAHAERLAKLTQQHSQTESRRTELTGILVGQPGKSEVQTLLDRLDELEEAAERAQKALVAARRHHAEAEANKASAEDRAKAGRQQLNDARDPLTRYGAPALTDTSIAAAWEQLSDWASAQLVQLQNQIGEAASALATTQEKYSAALETISEALTGHDLEPTDPTMSPGQIATTAARQIAGAHASARAAVQQAEERLSERERLEEQRDQAERDAQVANALAQLLRSDNFQAWLIESALSSLVADASDILMEMSSGQFELRHRDKDLEVIDHNDADSTRPVRTLSGGETFQASLSLALALSRQVAALAVSGAAKLEAIFLDEGFGTLDDTSLDVVATTLETLANSGERMVGVITHVQALAERIPVRFSVTRTGSTSTIERVTA